MKQKKPSSPAVRVSLSLAFHGFVPAPDIQKQQFDSYGGKKKKKKPLIYF